MRTPRTTVSLADPADRSTIYRLRHDVYARELGQHHENDEGRLSDALDRVNVYLVARRGQAIIGFIAITPPNPVGYSIDKYFAREDLPLTFDDGLYEVRLLTVVVSERRSMIATLLMYSALRYVESSGGRVVVAIGRREILGLYERAGLQPHGLRTSAGAVTYELMSAPVASLRRHMESFATLIQRFESALDWRVGGVTYRPQEACLHGGAFWEAIGETFDTLERRNQVISADVLDAWFDPAPGVVQAVARTLTFALKTSPPTGGGGLRRVIAGARGVADENILPGAGSSDLIFGVLRGWVTPQARVLILDPMYGEYAHVLERVIGATVERLTLSRADGYALEPTRLRDAVARGYDWIVIVNPNSPTGRHVPRWQLEELLSDAPAATRIWVDETYVEYAGEDQSLEAFAARSSNVVVVKSMSKVYALSGVRAGYVCASPSLIAEAERWSPPWSVSLPAQIAACEVFACLDYYRRRWQETAVLREELRTALAARGWDVVPGCANFLLAHLPPSAPDASAFTRSLRQTGLFIRDLSSMESLGSRAVRIAVKDRETNHRMIALLAAALDRGRLGASAVR